MIPFDRPEDDFAEGDCRRCERHGFTTSSPDGLFDGPCPGCEAEMDMTGEPRETPTECSEACGGNGWIDCWDCGGSGTVTIPDDDVTDIDIECVTCLGNGGWRCQVCELREAFGTALHETRETDYER